MTIFTKAETTEEKKNVDAKEETPKQVVVCEADEEKHISNCGWVPMEGGNFDKPKEKRSSSFGPLSIIRLSPSPLARTPSPSPPDYENAVNSRRMRRCTKLTFTLITIFTAIIIASLFLYQHGLINMAYQKGVFHGWNAATNANNSLTERLVKNVVMLKPTESYRRDLMPVVRGNRPAIFLHDLEKNLTMIIDMLTKKCFVKDLSAKPVKRETNYIDALRAFNGAPNDSFDRTSLLREQYRVGRLLTVDEIAEYGSKMLSRHCGYRQTYTLVPKDEASR